MDKAAKNERKRLAKAARREAAEAEWAEHMILQPEQLKALLDFLDEQLTTAPCDHTPRMTRSWASANGVDAAALEESLLHFGGGCDCEVLANVDPLTQVDGWPAYVSRFGP